MEIYNASRLGLFTITTLFSLATTHASLALRQLLNVIPLVGTNPTSTQHLNLRHDIDRLQFAKNALYLIAVGVRFLSTIVKVSDLLFSRQFKIPSW